MPAKRAKTNPGRREPVRKARELCPDRKADAAKTDTDKADIVIVGGGMAGLCAAIEAASAGGQQSGGGNGGSLAEPADRDRGNGLTILLLDADERPGRKILATGNGRCNVTNRDQTAGCYRWQDGSTPFPFFEEGWDQEVTSFLRSLGILVHERNGYVYPRTDQAATVLDGLLRAVSAAGVRIFSGHRVLEVQKKEDGGFAVSGKAGEEAFRVSAKAVILAVGGKVSSLWHCAGDGYELAGRLGHHVLAPVPALCALQDEDPFRKIPAGVRTAARVTLQADGRTVAESVGEIQMTAEGISGIPVFQVSRFAARAQKDRPGCEILAKLDFLPELSPEEWEKEKRRRLSQIALQDTLGDFCLGLVPDKISSWLIAGRGEVKERKIAKLRDRSVLEALLDDMRGKIVKICGVSGFEKAQVTAGGVLLSEVTDRMESVKQPGVFLAGELLDVDGICGGYNLTWALHSGRLAGESAALRVLEERKQHD